MPKKVRKTVGHLVGANIGFGIGGAIVGSAGGNTAGISAGAGMMPVVGTAAMGGHGIRLAGGIGIGGKKKSKRKKAIKLPTY